MKNSYVEIFVLFAIPWFACAQDLGQNCIVSRTEKEGTCKRLKECPSVEEEARNGISPTICSFERLTVCCERTEQLNSNDDRSDFFYPDSIPSVSKARESKSSKKCEEYANLTINVVQATALVPNYEPITINVMNCDNTVPLIVGGSPASAGEFPFMAAIGFSLNEEVLWKCGGTLISERFVVTAAHCTTSRDAGAPVLVRLGELDLSTDEDGSKPVDYDISNIIVHPDYRYPQKYNDIALLRLRRTVTFTKFIRPACLFTEDSIPQQRKALAAGWGKTDYLATSTSKKLLKVALDVLSNDRCGRTYKPTKYIPEGIKETMLCAGELQGGKDTCQGDSGGPLLINGKNSCIYHIIGITSFGKNCGASNIPAVYTRVSKYVSWIEENVW